MGADYRASFRRVAAGSAVLLLHAAVVAVLLLGRSFLITPADDAHRITWIILPAERAAPAPPVAAVPAPALYALASLWRAPLPEISPLPELTIPQSLPPPVMLDVPPFGNDAKVLSGIGDFLRCDYVHYEGMADKEKVLCASSLTATREQLPQVDYQWTDDVAAKRTQWAADLKNRTPPAALAAGDPRLAMRCTWDHGVCWQDDSFDLGCANPGKYSLAGIGKDLELAPNLIFSAALVMDSSGCFGMFRIGLTYRW